MSFLTTAHYHIAMQTVIFMLVNNIQLNILGITNRTKESFGKIKSFEAFNGSVKGKWQQKFLLSHLKETLIYRGLLQNFYICFTSGDIVT